MTGIGENIKKLRKAKGLTQDELAAKLNISGQAVSKWENGGSPDVDMLPALATAFGITIDELMGFKLKEHRHKAIKWWSQNLRLPLNMAQLREKLKLT